MTTIDATALILTLAVLAAAGCRSPRERSCRESIHRLHASAAAPVSMTFADCPAGARASLHVTGESVVAVCKCSDEPDDTDGGT